MNINIDLPENSVEFLLNLLPICIGLASFFLGVSLAKKHFGHYLTDDLDETNY